MSYSQRQKQLIKYIQENPQATYKEIQKNTKIHLERQFSSMKELHKAAGTALPKRYFKRDKQQQKQAVIKYIQENPGARVTEIQQNVGVAINRVFGSIVTAYQEAKVKYPMIHPTSGVANPNIVTQAVTFENEVCQLLRKWGEVRQQVHCDAGFVDAIFTCSGLRYIVEIKNFRARNNITKSQLKQLWKYMDSLNCDEGLLVCPKNSFPKHTNSRVTFKKGKRIRIVSPSDLLGS